MRRVARVAVFSTVLLAVLVVLSACGKDQVVEVEPKVAPPAVKQAGVLLAGVDLSTPPFAGVDDGERAGIDIDVASALAGSLGLDVKFVDVKPSEAATALAEGRVDVVLSVPLATADLTRMSSAGTYLHDGPAFFSRVEDSGSIEPTVTLDNVSTETFAVQTQSESFWILQQDFGPEMVQGYDSLREAFSALDKGEKGLVAGDAIVGSYIAQDFDGIALVGQLTDTQPLVIAIAPDQVELGESVRTSLDQMAAGGVIEAIVNKWVPQMPKLRMAAPDSPQE